MQSIQEKALTELSSTTRAQPRNLLATLRRYKHTGQKGIAVLLDPDKVEQDAFSALMTYANRSLIDFIFVGGSLVTEYTHRELIAAVRRQTDIPVFLFPGNSLHIEPSADGILLLSLISGRNPDFLIGQHVIAAPLLKRSGLEILPTGYMVVDSGAQTTVSYISGTMPLPHDKPSVAACTAMAGEMLGLQLIYMDAGSGAHWPVSAAMIRAVRESVDLPIVVGGGLNTPERVATALEAGADLVVVGNSLEKNPALLPELAAVVDAYR